MGPHITREEFQDDLKTIVVAAVTEANLEIKHVIHEDLVAIDQRIDQMNRSVESANEKNDFTHKLLQVHVANPSAHSRPQPR